ncbi:class I SAM-dependent methyltransferase [Viridibacillus sp. YIM B01967]|uniref:Class I SAM-dependent methyltransferase n=1 Tax=Viridibacillus soli TaxID=2798301 RepID=A0ABS1H1S3_9BACL|nr:class I SAM-dependent methyltransferase [Viridibacillus soli]MBK3493351.1 class I SAM-dependent methyltransferase [Viridibacillus soli]
MSSYQRFAEVYDALMTDIPYDAYVDWVVKNAPSSSFPKLLDVGCGTGVMATKFTHQGYAVSGVDISEEMLAIASGRFTEEKLAIPLFCQSMDELDGFSDLNVVTIPIDSLNYLEDEAAVIATFKSIYAALCDGGHLFFDVHSLFKMDTIFLDGPFTYDDGEITYIWDTEMGEAPHSVHHDMTFYVQADEQLFERFEEYHYQRTFPVEQYMTWLRDAGFSTITITADYTAEAPTAGSERLFFHVVK